MPLWKTALLSLAIQFTSVRIVRFDLRFQFRMVTLELVDGSHNPLRARFAARLHLVQNSELPHQIESSLATSTSFLAVEGQYFAPNVHESQAP